jgi:hypothetical protein
MPTNDIYASQASATKLNIEFLRRDGKMITRHTIFVRAEGDLERGIGEAYARFRREHPDQSAFDPEVSIRRAE